MNVYVYVHIYTHTFFFSILNKATADLKKHSEGYM